MPDPNNLYRVCGDAINDLVGPDGGDLTRAGDKTGATALRQVFEAVARGDQGDGYSRRGGGRSIADISPDRRQILQRLVRKDYRHFGTGVSFGVPHDRSQSRTLSYGVDRRASSDANPASTANTNAASSSASGVCDRFNWDMKDNYHVRTPGKMEMIGASDIADDPTQPIR